VVLGVVTAALQQKEWAGRFLRRLGFRTIHPIPTAWDWHFSHGKPYWVVVTLKNRSRIYDVYGEHSFAGDDPQYRDLYLEATYRQLTTGDWAPSEDTAGVLIMAEQIAVLEFRQFSEVKDE
jgi:hypothetical protein